MHPQQAFGGQSPPLALNMGVTMQRLVALLIAGSVPSAASGANWVFVAHCGVENQLRSYSYDAQSVRRDRDGLVVKLVGDYSRDKGSRAREARMTWFVDCAARTFVERERTEYDNGRAVVQQYREPTAFSPVLPGSVAEKLFTKVCA